MKRVSLTSSGLAAFTGILGAVSFVLSMLETLMLPELPFLPPGVKPGLSNLATMTAAMILGPVPAVFVVLFKSLFVLITRGASAFFMSISGGLLSVTVLLIMLRLNFRHVSLVGISVLSACAHNCGQLLMYMLLTKSLLLYYYLPVLLLFGLVSGIITGLVMAILVPKVRDAVSEIKVFRREK